MGLNLAGYTKILFRTALSDPFDFRGLVGTYASVGLEHSQIWIKVVMTVW